LTIGTHRVILAGYPKAIFWDERKDILLQLERGIGFSLIAEKLGRNAYLAVVDHWNQQLHPGQRVFVIDIDGYAHYVPFAETHAMIFLKTVFPSRKATQQYRRAH
jgi:hypothetical protein